MVEISFLSIKKGYAYTAQTQYGSVNMILLSTVFMVLVSYTIIYVHSPASLKKFFYFTS